MKKILAIILTFVLLTSALPITAFAVETQQAETGAEVYTDGDYSFIVLDDGTAQITKYNGTETELTVPAILGANIPVTQIGSEAFKDNDDIRKLTFPRASPRSAALRSTVATALRRSTSPPP